MSKSPPPVSPLASPLRKLYAIGMMNCKLNPYFSGRTNISNINEVKAFLPYLSDGNVTKMKMKSPLGSTVHIKVTPPNKKKGMLHNVMTPEAKIFVKEAAEGFSSPLTDIKKIPLRDYRMFNIPASKRRKLFDIKDEILKDVQRAILHSSKQSGSVTAKITEGLSRTSSQSTIISQSSRKLFDETLFQIKQTFPEYQFSSPKIYPFQDLSLIQNSIYNGVKFEFLSVETVKAKIKSKANNLTSLSPSRHVTEKSEESNNLSHSQEQSELSEEPLLPKSSKSNIDKDLAARFLPSDGTWQCEMCMISNKDEFNLCVSCTAPRTLPSRTRIPNATVSMTYNLRNTNASSIKPDQKLLERFRLPAGSWICDTCMVTNKEMDRECVSCTTPNPIIDSITSTIIESSNNVATTIQEIIKSLNTSTEAYANYQKPFIQKTTPDSYSSQERTKFEIAHGGGLKLSSFGAYSSFYPSETSNVFNKNDNNTISNILSATSKTITFVNNQKNDNKSIPVDAHSTSNNTDDDDDNDNNNNNNNNCNNSNNNNNNSNNDKNNNINIIHNDHNNNNININNNDNSSNTKNNNSSNNLILASPTRASMQSLEDPSTPCRSISIEEAMEVIPFQGTLTTPIKPHQKQSSLNPYNFQNLNNNTNVDSKKTIETHSTNYVFAPNTNTSLFNPENTDMSTFKHVFPSAPSIPATFNFSSLTPKNSSNLHSENLSKTDNSTGQAFQFISSQVTPHNRNFSSNINRPTINLKPVILSHPSSTIFNSLTSKTSLFNVPHSQDSIARSYFTLQDTDSTDLFNFAATSNNSSLFSPSKNNHFDSQSKQITSNIPPTHETHYVSSNLQSNNNSNNNTQFNTNTTVQLGKKLNLNINHLSSNFVRNNFSKNTNSPGAETIPSFSNVIQFNANESSIVPPPESRIIKKAIRRQPKK